MTGYTTLNLIPCETWKVAQVTN